MPFPKFINKKHVVPSLLTKNKLFVAVHTLNANFASGSDAHSATGANVFATAGFLQFSSCESSAVSSCACNLKTAELVSVYENIGKSVFDHKVQKGLRRFGVRPAVFVTVGNAKTVAFGASLESFVVVGVSSAAVLNSVFIIVIVNHFMEQSGGDLFNRSCDGASADVDFVALAVLGDPGVVS